MKKLLSILLLAISLNALAEQVPALPMAACLVEAPYGFPSSKKQDTSLICRTAYALEHDNKAKIPVWVSYTLTPEHSIGCLPRVNAFAPDKSVISGATLKDYAKSGYDMGHQANSGDMRWDENVQIESFILSNMAPQLPVFNRQIWKKLEDATRGWAISRSHELLIYVGPIYDRAQDKFIGPGMVTVPHAFYKIITDTKTSEVQVFLFKHEGSDAELSTFITSLAEVQRLTDLVFPMPDVPVFSGFWPIQLKNALLAKREVCAR
jgi:endonuclease G